MSANIVCKLVNLFQEQQAEITPVEKLSDRENELWLFLAKELLYKEKADKLSISTSTVGQDIHKIYEKLHVRNRTEAINNAFGEN